MNKPENIEFQELPLAQIHPHNHYAPVVFGVSDEDKWLFDSIRELGLLTPLVVMKEESDVYRIVDGHRRYLAASALKYKSVFCSISPCLRTGDYELLRWTLYNTHKPLTRGEVKEMRKRLMKYCEDQA